MLELLRARRSIRQFTDKRVEQEKVDLLTEALLRSPSSRGRNPWEFIIVDDSEQLTALSKAKEHGSAFIGKAPLAVVVIADPEKCDVWVEDCSIAAIICQLAAESIGLKSCWAQLRLRPHDHGSSAEEYIRTLLHIPESYRVPMVLGVGYGAEEKGGHSAESLQQEKIHRHRFGGNE